MSRGPWFGPATAVAAVLLLLPAVAGGVGAPAPSPAVVGPPFHLLHRWNVSSSNLTYRFGCSQERFSAPEMFHSFTGRLRIGMEASASNCPSPGAIGSNTSWSMLYVVQTLYVPVPIPTNGTHSVRADWTAALNSAAAVTSGNCPKKTNFVAPPASGSAYCSAQAVRYLSFAAQLQDLTLGYAFPISGSLTASRVDQWSNLTSCGPLPGGSGWGCTTSSAWTNQSLLTRLGANVSGPWNWTGATNVSLWTTGSHLRSADRYVVELRITLEVAAIVNEANLVSVWPASARADLHLARAGGYLALDSVSVL